MEVIYRSFIGENIYYISYTYVDHIAPPPRAHGRMTLLTTSLNDYGDMMTTSMPSDDHLDGVTATAVGVDPGFAKTGIAVVRRVAGQLVSGGVVYCETEPLKARGGSAGMDDARRIHEQWQALRRVVEAARPNVLGVESYTVHTPRGVDTLKVAATRLANLGVPTTPQAFLEQLSDPKRARRWIEAYGALGDALRDSEGMAGVGLGNAAKTIVVWGVASAVAYEAGVPVYVFTPADLKRRACGKLGSSKEEVGACLEREIAELRDDAAGVAAGKRNHVHDAAGHALLALESYERWWSATHPR